MKSYNISYIIYQIIYFQPFTIWEYEPTKRFWNKKSRFWARFKVCEQRLIFIIILGMIFMVTR